MKCVSYALDVEIELQGLQHDKLDVGDVFLFEFIDGSRKPVDIEYVIRRLSRKKQADWPLCQEWSEP